ncbi:Lrp/AsnC family transcriptional regulator (plasmid) [Citricoccus sp. SGAir0253]|uniref:Lrp/AsnC ligand binding domain-containing protein n=1 Tax=Citricoccus sp. SGAir0253 TaxID=2567881 RepID=UPI0010CCE16D|nr:Lrp/AsnC ligand binding domain-containing protein [Citricoccus sp. SGAir0253]QCU79647.1 Lrp/AsnC family transcriptional regulator [Citricoccus sp. SGAir0253]
MELPPDDLELVHALQIAPRASWAQLGTALRRHPATLAARWSRLTADGRAWITGHLGAAGVHGHVAFINVECRPGSRVEVLERLCAAPEIDTVEEAARAWDARLTVVARNWQSLTRQVLPKVRADPDVTRTQMTVATRLFSTGGNWRLDVLSPEQQRRVTALHVDVVRPAGATPPHLEKTLAVLARDGRATAADIAAATGTHPTTAARQLREALESGVVALRCELAQEHSGYPVACQWYVRIPPAQLDAAVQYLRSRRTLRLCASTTGDANLTFFLWLRAPADIADVEAGLQAAAPGAQVVESDVGVRTHKRMGWLLREDSRATGEVVTGMPHAA